MSDDKPQTAGRPPDELDADGLDLPEQAAELGEDEPPEILPARGPLRTALHGLSVFEQAIGVLLLLAILIMVLIQVGQRYVPDVGIPPTGELARLSMVWVTFVLAGYLMAHDRHIAIHVVDYFLPVRVLGVVQLMASVVVLLTCLGMGYATWDLIATDRGQRTAEAEIPLMAVYAVVLFGFVSTAIRALVTIAVRDVPEIVAGRKPI
ncbi:MAG TPA: TRAP transporter small permease [Candidatus Limnocylindrales bacterium]|nr:TRAP transporter small permease [Candidatus Limnocylindrales bacterium]